MKRSLPIPIPRRKPGKKLVPTPTRGVPKAMPTLQFDVREFARRLRSNFPSLRSDVKDSKTALVSLKDEGELKLQVAMARSAISSAYGVEPVGFHLPVSTTFTATVTTGVTNTSLTLRISDSVEYASLAALFDEFRMTGGQFDYDIVLPTPTIVLGTSSLSYDTLAAMGYDPSDNTAPSTARAVCELGQHKQLFPRISATPTVGTYVGLYGKVDSSPYVFKWSTAKVAQVVDSLGNVTNVGGWKGASTSPVPQSDGFLKVYYQSGATTAVTSIVGTVYFHTEFRSRS